MTLGTLYRTLDAIRASPEMRTLPVSVCGTGCLGLTSWRGVYAQAAIDFGASTPGRTKTLDELADELDDALHGKEFQGYKGGTYTYDESTPVWASPWGESQHLAITGVHLGIDCLVLATVDIEEYAI
jgi:hypothetical protein